MSAPDFPWVIPAIRLLLISDPTLAYLTGQRVGTRLPDKIPGTTIKLSATALPVNVPAGVWSPLVQVDAYTPPVPGAADPEELSWIVATKAAGVLSTVRNRQYENMHFSARITDGPLTDIDTTRGDGNPLYRALIRAELLVHAR